MLPTPPPSPINEPASSLGLVLANRFQLTEVLGVGAYGTVYRAHDIRSGARYAVKALPKSDDPRHHKFLQRELALHHAASSHPHVASLLHVVDSPDTIYAVVEYCDGGDLFTQITSHGKYVGDDARARNIFLQILDAVAHCHSRGIYHRDLKPENILVCEEGWIVKLADFGLATQDNVTSDFGCGSTFYMSPECQQTNPPPNSAYASAPNDVWALGVILVNLTCGRNPWKRASPTDSTFREFMRDPNFLSTILPISKELNYILKLIFDLNPSRRIGLAELRSLVARTPHLTRPATPPTPSYSPV
ncbi:kinase-like protein, partial [Piedraia hortae CBS 480.64]